MPTMTPTTEFLVFEKTPTIRYLVAPIHKDEGEMVRKRMTRKLEEVRVTEEVRRAINAWMYG
jgi:hypothetical protein